MQCCGCRMQRLGHRDAVGGMQDAVPEMQRYSAGSAAPPPPQPIRQAVTGTRAPSAASLSPTAATSPRLWHPGHPVCSSVAVMRMQIPQGCSSFGLQALLVLGLGGQFELSHKINLGSGAGGGPCRGTSAAKQTEGSERWRGWEALEILLALYTTRCRP